MLAFMRRDVGLDKGEIIDQDNSPDILLASFGYSTASITWDLIKKFMRGAEVSVMLANWITNRCPGPITSLPQDLQPFW